MLRRVRAFVFALVSHAFAQSSDVIEYILQRREAKKRGGLNAAEKAKLLELGGTDRLAIVVLHPRFVEFSIHNLIDALAGEGFAIVAVSSAPLPADIDALIRSSGGRVVKRRHVGRDMGGYKDVLVEIFDADARFRSVETLILTNDSLFWNCATKEHLRQVLSCKPAWASLTESFVGRYHAQSYFLCMSRDVAFSAVHRNFWQRYSAFDHRRHVVEKGEIALSQTLAKTFGKPFCLFSGARIVQALLRPDLDRGIASILAVEIEKPADTQCARAAAEFMLRPKTNAPPTRAMYDGLRRVAQVARDHNPTHALALTLNHLFKASLKRDIAFRQTLELGFAPWALLGYTDAEKQEIDRDLRERGLSGDLPLRKRMLLHTGRI